MSANREGPSLSAGFLKHLGLEAPAEKKDNGRYRAPSRKERRKEERSHKKGHHASSDRQGRQNRHHHTANERRNGLLNRNTEAGRHRVEKPRKPFKPVAPERPDDDVFDGFESSDAESDMDEAPKHAPPKVSKAVRDRLAADDEEIADLERKLGLKKRKTLPKSFRDDGLDELLGEIEEGDQASQDKKKRKAEADEWLAQKRRKASARDNDDGPVDTLGDSDVDSDEDALDDANLDAAFDDELLDENVVEDEGASSDELLEDDDDDLEALDFDDDDDDLDDSEEEQQQQQPRKRENPYVAPTTANAATAKYVPPSRRQEPASDRELVSRIRKQVQGLVNRLTESNLVAILDEIQKIYRSNPRQHVTDSLVDVLLVQIAEPTSLPDTLLILLAGFATAVYKVMGTDFGAHLVQRTVEQFRSQYERARDQAADQAGASKESSNLITFITELYSFKMVGANLVFDYIRLLLSEFTELNAELLLRIIRMSGPQLRQDDPLALKDIVALIRPAIARAGEKNVSVRTKFMVDTINDLKNNKVRAGASASAVVSEHVTRMKKLLGSLNSRKLESTEPLRMGLKDIEDSEKKGKWWLVGASWAGASKDQPSRGESGPETKPQMADDDDDDVLGAWGETVPDVSELEQLAREQGMNTDVRRSIFVALLSAADYEDAFNRLQRLRLNKYDKREIPNVLIQCVGSEQHYNAYYTLIARRMCSDRKVQWAFQDSLWKLFKRLGEPLFGEEEDDQEDDEAMDLRRLVNIARMYGSLLAAGALGVSILKPLNLPYLQPKTRSMVEMMLVTVLQEAEKQKGREAAAVVSGLFKTAEDTGLIRGLQYFVRKVVRKSEAMQGKRQAKKLSKLCDVAEKTLVDASVATTVEADEG